MRLAPNTLHAALGASLALHAGLLALQLADPQALQRAFTAPQLEVVLVNARSTEAPQKAQALAQAQLAGGGQADAPQRSTSPLPAAAQWVRGQDSREAQQRIEQLQREQAQLLARLQRDAGLALPQDAQHTSLSPAQQTQEQERRRVANELAQIERRINEENAQPRRRFVSPATREVAYAMYYDAMRQRIEDRGTREFPQAGGRKLYGELTMNITVDTAGRVLLAEIVQSSGEAALDERAIAIVRAAAPFGYFSVAMRREYDQLVLTSRFRFTRDDALQTSASVAGR